MKYLLIIFIVFYTFSCTDDTEKTYPDPNGFYYVDIKTDWFEKTELQGMKAGILNYVEQVAWMDETEVGEDFEIWLDNVKSSKISEIRTKINVDLIIKKSTTFGADEVYNERIEFYYDMPENIDEIMLSGDKAKDFIEKSLKLSATLNAVGLGIEVTTGLLILNKLLDIFNSTTNSNKYKAEALLTGNIIGEKIKRFYLSYEKEL